MAAIRRNEEELSRLRMQEWLEFKRQLNLSEINLDWYLRVPKPAISAVEITPGYSKRISDRFPTPSHERTQTPSPSMKKWQSILTTTDTIQKFKRSYEKKKNTEAQKTEKTSDTAEKDRELRTDSK
jgi:hypothetical protein